MPTPFTPKQKKPGPPTKPKPRSRHQDPVQVFCRLRPIKSSNDVIAIHRKSDREIEVRPTDPATPPSTYTFSKVFDAFVGQRVVFQKTTLPLVEDLFAGNNACIFTYGVTGSGKTHTITGTPTDSGLIPRALDTIFNSLCKSSVNLQIRRNRLVPNQTNGFDIVPAPDVLLNDPRAYPNGQSKTDEAVPPEWKHRIAEDSFVKDVNCDYNYAIFVSFVQIHNNFINDLLEGSEVDGQGRTPAKRKMASKLIREVPGTKKMFVADVVEREVKSTEEALGCFVRGLAKRSVAKTSLNDESSRSHTVFTIRLVKVPLDPRDGVELLDDTELIECSELSIVDLAGSERTGRTQATGALLAEGSQINSSLMTLRQCFRQLRENQKGRGLDQPVAFRNSKLTLLFRNFFEGSGKLAMILCVNPGAEDLAENRDVFAFGEMSQELATARTPLVAATPRFANLRRFFEVDSPLMPTKLAALPTFGPALPEKFLEDDPSNEDIIPLWIRCIEERERNREKMDEIRVQKEASFRQVLVRLTDEHALLKDRLVRAENDLVARERQLQDTELRMAEMSSKMADQSQVIKQLHEENRALLNRVSTAELATTKLQREREQLQEAMGEKLQRARERMKRRVVELLSEKDEEIQQEKDKIKLVIDMLSKDGVPENMFLSPPPKVRKGETRVKHLRAQFDPAYQNNAAKVGGVSEEPVPEVAAVNEDDAELEYCGPPVVNPRHRRSLSTGERWIDHRPKGTLDLGTVMQPAIKNGKSVTNLKASDFTSKGKKHSASKYVLTHHEATSSGTVKTEVYKGDVIPSVTGGAQVIFNDVETLAQTSPVKLIKAHRKRLNLQSDTPSPTVRTGTQAGSSSAISTPSSSDTPIQHFHASKRTRKR